MPALAGQQLAATAVGVRALRTCRGARKLTSAPSRRAQPSSASGALPAAPLPELAGGVSWSVEVTRNTLTLHQVLQHLEQLERVEATAGRCSSGVAPPATPRQQPISWVDHGACAPATLLDCVLSETEEVEGGKDGPLAAPAAAPAHAPSASQRAALALRAWQAAEHAKPAGLDADAALALPGLADVAVVSRGGWQRATWKPCNQDSFLALPLAAPPPAACDASEAGACCPPALALGVFDGHGREGAAAAAHLRNALASGLLVHNQLALLARQPRQPQAAQPQQQPVAGQPPQQQQPVAGQPPQQQQPVAGQPPQHQQPSQRQRPPADAAAAAAADEAAALLERCFAAAAATLPSTGADFSLSGSTAVLCLVQPGGVTAAWAGDSRAVLGLRRGRRYIAAALTHDHRPSSPLERARIEAAGGWVLQAQLDEEGRPAGPHRVYLKESTLPGLAVSRCFGDYVAATAGVTSTPDITSLLLPLPPAASQQHQRQQHGQQPHGPRQQRGPRRGPPPAATAAASGQHILIVASDGLWEFVSSAEAVRIASRCTCAAAAAERLVQQARAQWASRFGGQLCDDVTVAVAFLPGAPPSATSAGAAAAAAGSRRGSRRRRPQGNGTAAAAAAAAAR